MAFLAKALPILSTLIVGIFATLPTSYDVAWTTPGVNGSADSMPLGGGDIGINTWFEDSKLPFVLYPISETDVFIDQRSCTSWKKIVNSIMFACLA
jgi:hypothetical protein